MGIRMEGCIPIKMVVVWIWLAAEMNSASASLACLLVCLTVSWTMMSSSVTAEEVQ
jgi:hypothetical protein